MAAFIENIKNSVKQGDVLTRIILANIFVYVIFFIISLFLKDDIFSQYIMLNTAVSSKLEVLAYHPWTVFTYMFVHFDFFHILFNMLFLYSFGRLFLLYFSPKNLGSLYLLGGLGGAILFLLSYNLIPYFAIQGNSLMIGASASAMAIIFAIAFYVPNMYVNLMLLGRVKIIYLALALFLIDLIFVGASSNQGGHISHIGGALVGFIYAKQYAKGKDITRWLSGIIDKIVNMKKPTKKNSSPKMKVKYKKAETDYEYNQRKAHATEEVDKILDKIKESGYSSLTKSEKKKLFDESNK